MQKQLMECTWEDGDQEITIIRVVSLNIDLEKGEIIARTKEEHQIYRDSNKYTLSKDNMKKVKVTLQEEEEKNGKT